VARGIDALLNSYHYRALQRMAEAAGLPFELRKDDLIAEMKRRFFTQERVGSALEGLDEREKAVLNGVLQHGGEVSTSMLRRELVRAGLVRGAAAEGLHRTYSSRAPYAVEDYLGRASRADSDIFVDVVARLTLHGLVFSCDTAQSTGGTPYKVRLHPASTLYIPDAIRPWMPEPEALTPPLDDWEPDRVDVGMPDLLLRDLYLYWDLVRRGEVSLIQSGFVGKRSLRAINEVLLRPDTRLEEVRREDDTERLYVLRQLLGGLGLVYSEGRRLRTGGDDPLEIPAFWSWDQVAQIEACLKVWPIIEGGAGVIVEGDAYHGSYARARRVILEVLAAFQSGVWHEPGDVLMEARAQDVNFLFDDRQNLEQMRHQPYHRYYVRSITDRLRAYDQLEFDFVRACMQGFLNEVGVLDLGYEEGLFRGFRVTPAGDAMLSGASVGEAGVADGRAARHQGKLIIQPTFAVIAMGPVGLDVMARLDLFAERERADRAVFEYRLSREMLYEAQQRGVSASQVIDYLEDVSETGLPQNVRRSLEDWRAHHERIVFRSGVSLLQAADAEALEAVMSDSEAGQHLARAVAPAVALIKDRQRQPLIDTLVRQGRFPARSDARPSAADNSVVIHPDGTVEPVHRVPGFHLRARLARVAERGSDATWRLTPSAIRRAGGSSSRVLDLLDELQRLQRGRLPQKVRQRVKALGGYYGTASAETITLVAFRDRETLDELREDPELDALLTPFSAGDRALAVVPTESLPRLREVLATFGVPLEEGLRDRR
jgi:hypothetical protein